MALNGSEMPSRIQAPLSDFIKFLKGAQNITGIISLPATLLKVTRDHFYARPQPSVSRSDLKALVQAIDLPGSNLLKRVDSLVFQSFYGFLRLGERCLAHRRAYCLMAESLHPVAASSDSTRTLQKQKKKELGSKTIDRLLAGFLKVEESVRARRWMGSLAAELLFDCKENKAHLRGIKTNLWQPLGEVIIHGNDETLKLIAGTIIRDMLLDGVPASEFWHAGIDSAAYRRFPCDKSSATQWVEDFTAFVDDLGSQKILTQKRSTIVFAHAVFIQGARLNADGSASVLVTITNDLTIMITRTEKETARYIDIPLSNVKDASITVESLDSQLRSASTSTTSVLHIFLKDSPHSAYYINELERSPCNIDLAFDAFEDAKMVAIHMGFEQNVTKQTLEPGQHMPVSRLPEDSAKLRISQSELIDVSEQPFDEDGHTVIKDGDFMAAQADGDPMEQDSAILISKNIHVVQHDDFKKLADEAAKDKATANVAKKRTQLFSVAQSPIDVSLVDDVEAEAGASSQNDLDAAELNRSSVEEWRKGTQAIGDASRLKQLTPSGQDQASDQQTTDDKVDWSLRSDNDLYDASPAPEPKEYQAQTKESIKSATQARKEGGHVPRGKLSRSMRTMNGAVQSAPMHDALSTSFKPYNQKARSNPAKTIQKRPNKPRAFKSLTSHLADKVSSDHEFWETGNQFPPDAHNYTPRVTERLVDEFDIPSSSPGPQLPRLKAKKLIQNAQYKKPNKGKQPGKGTLQPKTTNGRITKSGAKHKSNVKISDYMIKNERWEENRGSKGSEKLLSENLGDVVIEEKSGVGLNAARITKGQAAHNKSQEIILNVKNPVNIQSKPLRSTRAAAQIANRKIQKINHTESLAEEQLDLRQPPNATLPASTGQNGGSLWAAPPTAQESPSDNARKPEEISNINRDINAFRNQASNGYKTAKINFKRSVNQIVDDNTTSGIQVPRSSPFLPPEGTSPPHYSPEKEIAAQSNLNKATYSISHVSESNQTPYLATKPPEGNLTIQDDEGMYFQDAMASYDVSVFARPSPSIRSMASQKSGLATGMTPAKIETAQETSTETQKHVAPIAQMQDCKEGHDDSGEPRRTLTDVSPRPNGMERLPLTDNMASEQTKTPLSTIAKDVLVELQRDQDQSTLIPEDVQEHHKPLKWPEETQSFASCMKNALSEVSNTERLVGRRNRPAKTPSKLKTGQAPRNNMKVKFMPVNEDGPLKNIKRRNEAPNTNSNGQRVALQETKINTSQEKAIRLYESALQLSDSDSDLHGRQSGISDLSSHNTSHVPDIEKEYAVHRTPKQVQPQDIESPTSSTYYKIATLLKDAASKPQPRPGAESSRSMEFKSEATRKRQLDNMEMPTRKRSRQSSQETEMPRGEEESKLKDPTRIPQITSFGINGPRNQGTPTPAKAERLKNSLEQNNSENQKFQRPSAKRKREQTTIEYKEDGMIKVHSKEAETQHIRKKERTDTDETRLPLSNITPYNERRTRPRKARSKEGATIVKQTRFPEMAEEPFHRFSSQSLRVAENGSPLPFQHTRSTCDLKTATMLENTHLEDFENIEPAADDDDLTLVPPTHVAARKLESRRPVIRQIERPFALAKTSPVRFIRSTGGKRRPGSPNASSSIVEDLHYHHVQLGGRLINIETAEPVVFAEPPDPFSEPTIRRPTNFISMLRAASISHKQNPVISKSHRDRLGDPDRTLVEAPFSCDKRQNDAVEISSGSEESESEDISQPVEANVGLVSDGTNAWREALQPHHGDTLGILYEISHQLTRNLVDAEAAVTDLVSDYKRRATRLVEQYERARKEEVERLKEEMSSKAEVVRRNLTEWHAQVAKNLEQNPVMDELAAKVEAEQRGIIAQIDEAIAMCGG